MSDELAEMVGGFVEEAHENFDAIESDLLSFEENPEDMDIVNGIFRVMHTIKGTAGFMGFNDIQTLAHRLESIMDKFRKLEITMNPELLDSLFSGIDLLKQMVFELVEEEKSEYPFQEILGSLDTILSGDAKPAAVAPQAPPVETAPTEATPSEEPEAQAPKESEVEISQNIIQEFVVEAEEHLVTIEENLLILEKEPDSKEPITELFRAIHSIKGTSDYVRLTKVTTLSHRLETVFDQIRKGTGLKYTNDLADVVLKSVDLLRTLVFMIKMGDDSSFLTVDDQLAQLDKFLGDIPKAAPAAAPESVPKAPPEEGDAFGNVSFQQLLAIDQLGGNVLENKATAEDLTALHRSIRTLRVAAENIKADALVTNVRQMEDAIVSVIAEEATQEGIKDKLSGLISQVHTEVDNISKPGGKAPPDAAPQPEAAPASVPVAPEKKEPEKAAAAPPKAAGPKAGPSKKADDGEIKTMRVEASRLDAFMKLIGELIIARNSFNHVVGELAGQSLPQNLMKEVKTVETSFNRLSDDLNNTLMEMRLVPVKTVFQKIPRMVRDISRKTKKKIQLQMVGEGTEIDKSIVEMLGDPLVHIIRNSCDHGIETPDVRAAAGKPEMGTIIIKATHLGSAIEIAIIDDGAGVNTEKVRSLAVKKGMVTAEEAEKLDVKTVNNFIFKPGFSTHDKVTELSGRGVGMDVVLTNINKIQGSVDVDSDWGNGSSVRLTLPLTLAVIDALIIGTEGRKFAVPLDAVKETMEVKQSTLQHLKQKEAIDLRGSIIGVSNLAQILGLKPKEEYEPDRKWSIVFLDVANKEMGIATDRLYSQQEIVVKPLQGYLTEIPGIKGSTILGSGDVILILEPSELIDLATG